MASNSVAGEAAFLQGQEIVNNARTTEYLRNGFGPPNLRVIGNCGCPSELLRTLIDCSDEPYVSPVLDPAPWYDVNYPESENFAGFLSTSLEGYDSTYTRTVTPVLDRGGVIGRLRALPRTLVWRGFLFGKTCCGTAYGLRWLTAILSQADCKSECSGEQLEFLICCPEVSGGCDALPPNTDAFRTAYQVGLLEGPSIQSERKGSCGCGCSAIMEIEFSLVAGNPHLYKEPISIGECVPFPPSACPTWLKVPPGVCPPVTGCPEGDPCAVDPGCPQPALPVIPVFVNPCDCLPLNPVTTCFDVPASTFGLNFRGEPIIQIFSGSAPIRNATIRIFENPQSLDCAVLTADPCFASCDDIRIQFIPPNATLTIDSVNRRIQIECIGADIAPGEKFLLGNFEWPLLECVDYCICIEVDGMFIESDACASVSVIPREM